jgi:hypothetical protein
MNSEYFPSLLVAQTTYHQVFCSIIIGAIFHQFPLNAQSLAPIMSNTVLYFPVLAVMSRSMFKKENKNLLHLLLISNLP